MFGITAAVWQSCQHTAVRTTGIPGPGQAAERFMQSEGNAQAMVRGLEELGIEPVLYWPDGIAMGSTR